MAYLATASIASTKRDLHLHLKRWVPSPIVKSIKGLPITVRLAEKPLSSYVARFLSYSNFRMQL